MSPVKAQDAEKVPLVVAALDGECVGTGDEPTVIWLSGGGSEKKDQTHCCRDMVAGK